MIYADFMRFLTGLIVLSMAATTGCRTTHEATEEEHEQLNVVQSTLVGTEDASGDFGETMLGPLTTLATPLGFLADKDRDTDSNQAALLEADETYQMLTSGPIRFVGDGSRAEFPECIVEAEEGRIEYVDCVLGAEISGIITAGLTVDGFYAWSDNTSASDLEFFAGADIIGIETGMSLDWQHDFAWTDTKFDGSFDITYVSGLTLAGLRTSGSVMLGVRATAEELTASEECDGPVSGILDMRARMQAGTDPIERVRVTVEWLGCEDALVTW